MTPELLERLACPACRGPLRLEEGGNGTPQAGSLVCACAKRFPIRQGIPRFVGGDGYAQNFSFEWTRFSRTQLDSANGRSESAERFAQSLNFPLEELRGAWVLDAGCGMGRFVEVALQAGARVVGMDLSFAVDAAAANLRRFPNAHWVQADLFAPPFRDGAFDFVYSLGVLHHTPEPRRAFEGLVRLVRPGGRISITLYSGYNTVYVRSTNAWRRLTTRLPMPVLYGMSHLAVPYYHLCRLPVLGLGFQALWPISMHRSRQWRVLDTFDCYSPRYQSYHTHPEVFDWFAATGLTDVAVLKPGISLIGTRPCTSA